MSTSPSEWAPKTSRQRLCPMMCCRTYLPNKWAMPSHACTSHPAISLLGASSLSLLAGSKDLLIRRLRHGRVERGPVRHPQRTDTPPAVNCATISRRHLPKSFSGLALATALACWIKAICPPPNTTVATILSFPIATACLPRTTVGLTKHISDMPVSLWN